MCDNKVNAIAMEKNNTIWFGTDNGVSRYIGEIISTSVNEQEQPPESFSPITTYPNPFNPSTTIEFTLPESGFASIFIYSLAGQKIRELAANFLTAGTHTLSWDGKDTNGNAVSSGIYIYRFQAGDYVKTGKMVMVR
ncbi:MAG: T9SS type A sorting domain-containing protein [Candidatus Latescibacteria bacterium]|nr:T9SS type A sorting domain-containing protein [Candidatus Latescibacterota bacterium]